MDEELNSYLLLVKHRLQQYVLNSNRSLNDIYLACNEGTKDHDRISYATIYNLINGDKLPTNLMHIRLICEILGADISIVLHPDESIQVERNSIPNNFETLDDSHYFHTYHVYHYSDSKTHYWINHSLLTIQKEGNQAIATLKIHHTFKQGGGHEEDETFVGTPIYNKEQGTVYMFLSSSRGRFYFIAFYYHNYNYSTMYYRKAVCITINSTTKAPMSKNMILLLDEPDEDIRDNVIPGLLKVEEGNFYIPRKEVEELVSNHQELKQFFEQFASDIGNSKEVYEFNPKKIYANFEDYQRDELADVEKNLYTFKAHSIGKIRNIYEQNDRVSLIMKKDTL